MSLGYYNGSPCSDDSIAAYNRKMDLAEERANKPIKVVCAWCGKTITEGKTLPDGSVSHGLCPTCYAEKFEPDLGPIEGGAQPSMLTDAEIEY